MRWMLVERKPDVVHVGAEIFLAGNGDQTEDRGQAMVFETREAAEAHRRRLLHPYHWVASSTDT